MINLPIQTSWYRVPNQENIVFFPLSFIVHTPTSTYINIYICICIYLYIQQRNWSAEEQGVLNDGDHHRGAVGDWRRPRSELGGTVDDIETTYVPAAACLPGPHRRHCVNIDVNPLTVHSLLVPLSARLRRLHTPVTGPIYCKLYKNVRRLTG